MDEIAHIDALPAEALSQLPPVGRYFAVWRRISRHLGPIGFMSADTLPGLPEPLRDLLLVGTLDNCILAAGNGFARFFSLETPFVDATRPALVRIGDDHRLTAFDAAVALLPGGMTGSSGRDFAAMILSLPRSSRRRKPLAQIEARYRQAGGWPNPSAEMLAYVDQHFSVLALPPIG